MRAWVLVIVLTGCLKTEVMECRGGFTCPAGSTCDEVRGGCLTEEQLRVCDGLDNGATCTIELADDGVCDQSVCVFATCGDSYRRPSEACDGTLFADINNCTQLGFYDDVPLSCTDRCELDQTVCTGFCGDALVDPAHELCDGGLPAESCVDFGFGTGLLQCSDSCGPAFQTCVPFGFTRIDMPGVMRHVHGTSSTNVWAVGDGGMVQRFDGASWSSVDVSACTTGQIDRIFVLSPTEAFISLAPGIGLVTAAGCTKYALDESLNAIWAASTTDAYVGGLDGLWHLEQGVWVAVDAVKTDALWGSSATDVYAGTDNGDLRHYDGVSWSAPAPVDGMTGLFAIWGTGPTDVFLSGGDATGAVIKRGSGTNWTNELAQSPMVGATSFATEGGIAGDRTFALVADFTNAPVGVLLVGRDGDWVNLGTSGELGRPFLTSDGVLFLVPGGHQKAIFRFTGTEVVSTPLAPRLANSLTALAQDEAYAVTPRFFQDGDLWAWNGSRWTQEQASNSREVLAVGDQVFALISSRIQRRTGPSTWVEQVLVSGASHLAGTSPTDLWVGGGASSLRHWNGSVLGSYTTPMTSVYDLWAGSPSFAVAVGYDVDGTTSTIGGAIAHWNGASWTAVAVPANLGTVTRVWGRSPTEVYAVAAKPNAPGDNLLRFNGTDWSAFPVALDDWQIRDVWSTGPDDVFVAGNRGLARFDGTRWTAVESGTTQGLTMLAGLGDTLFIGGQDGITQLVRTRPW